MRAIVGSSPPVDFKHECTICREPPSTSSCYTRSKAPDNPAASGKPGDTNRWQKYAFLVKQYPMRQRAQAQFDKEVQLGSLARLFLEPPLLNLRISFLGLVPMEESDKLRLIHHLPFPLVNRSLM